MIVSLCHADCRTSLMGTTTVVGCVPLLSHDQLPILSITEWNDRWKKSFHQVLVKRQTMSKFHGVALLLLLLIFDRTVSIGREGLRLVFEDKFEGSPSLNESVWNYNYPWGSTYNHQANMIRRQVTGTDAKQVKITALAVRTSSSPSTMTAEYGILDLDYTSGAIYTNSLITLKRGLTIVNMRVPSATSTWPMIMLVPLDETLPMLTMDVFSDRRNIGYSFRYTSPTGSGDSVSGVTRSTANTSLDYHSYAIDWGYDKVTFLVDNVLVRSFTKPTELKQMSEMSLVISLGVGGRSQTTAIETGDYPAVLSVNSVQMWEPRFDGRYKIMNANSKLFLEVENGVFTDFARVLQNTYKGTLAQQWDINYVGYNTYRVTNANSRKVLDVFDWQTNDGAKIVQYLFQTKDNQLWRIVENEDQNSTVTLINVWAQKAASFVGASTQAGTQLVLNEQNDGPDQKWILIPMSWDRFLDEITGNHRIAGSVRFSIEWQRKRWIMISMTKTLRLFSILLFFDDVEWTLLAIAHGSWQSASWIWYVWIGFWTLEWRAAK